MWERAGLGSEGEQGTVTLSGAATESLGRGRNYWGRLRKGPVSSAALLELPWLSWVRRQLVPGWSTLKVKVGSGEP